MPETQPLRIVAIPLQHAYVHNVRADGAGAWEYVPHADPPTPWFPPPRLDATWAQDHADEFDVMHVHFGFDAADPAALEDLADTLDANGRALVWTAHDLRNPHHTDPRIHERHLEVWTRRAHEIITLTAGAATELKDRYGVRAQVIAHPHVVPLSQMDRWRAEASARRRARERPRVGLHLKSLRPNMAAAPVLRALADHADDLEVDLIVDLHRDVLPADAPNHDPEVATLVTRLAAAGTIDLSVHDYYGRDEFHAYLASLDVSVLPYRFGTHSGWLEACRDVGTAVVAPDCGFYLEQGATAEYRNNERDGLDAGSLRDALEKALANPPTPIGREVRRRQRRVITRQHTEVYRRATRSVLGLGADPGAPRPAVQIERPPQT